MSNQETLNFISQQINIYFGLFILILGVTGGILNVIVFRTLKIFRETPCVFYLTVLSIVNIGQLLTALLVRVLSEGFLTDIRKISWVCKIQAYISAWCLSVSMTIMCLATIDQYVSMGIYRHYSTRRLSKCAVVLTCIFWSLCCICLFIYYDSPFGTCRIINLDFAIYSSYFRFPVLLGFFPLSTMTTFSILAFINTRRLTSRQINIVRLSRDRQLTAMTLFHAIFVVITTLPYIIFYIYSLNQTTKDAEQIARNNLIYSIATLIKYFSFADSFYLYCCVSERFRHQLLYVLTKICVNRWRQLINNWNDNEIVDNIEPIGDIQLRKMNTININTISIQ